MSWRIGIVRPARAALKPDSATPTKRSHDSVTIFSISC